MLRKIVNILMGAAEESELAAKTPFEGFLERAKPALKAKLASPQADPVDTIALTVMADPSLKAENASAQAARAFFFVLVENDKLPLGEQLELAELDLLKALLLEYFSGSDAVRARANEVLALIERKFSQGAFTQARILLQIFETDAETRLNNERNLFYEDMILRLGVRRRHEIPKTDRDELVKSFAALRPGDDNALRTLFAHIADEFFTHFCLLSRDPAQLAQWEKLTTHLDPEQRERVLRYVPPLRWRNPAGLPAVPLTELSVGALTPLAIRQHVQQLLRMCYFLLLASGDTGFEAYIYAFLRFCRERLGVDAKVALPAIHRRSVLEEKSLQETLDEVYDEYFATAVSERVVLDAAKIESAWVKAIQRLGALDFNLVPPGHYDFAGMLLDAALEFEQPEPSFAFRLYRLS